MSVSRQRRDGWRGLRAVQRVDGASSAPRIVLDEKPLQVARLRCGRCAWEGTFDELVLGDADADTACSWGGGRWPSCPVCRVDTWLDRAKEDETRRSG